MFADRFRSLFRSEVSSGCRQDRHPKLFHSCDVCTEGAKQSEQRTNQLTCGANMKQKFLVINCNDNDIDELRQRLGERPIVTCESMDELAQCLPASAAVVVSDQDTTTTTTVPTYNGAAVVDRNELDEMIERILEQNNGHAKTLAARVDMLEQKIIEYSLNRNGQHRKETAAELGISRVTLYNKMKKFGLLD